MTIEDDVKTVRAALPHHLRPIADRISQALEEREKALERIRVAQIVLEHWRDEAMKGEGVTRIIAHPCALALDALSGQIDPTELGISPGSDAERLLTALSPKDTG